MEEQQSQQANMENMEAAQIYAQYLAAYKQIMQLKLLAKAQIPFTTGEYKRAMRVIARASIAQVSQPSFLLPNIEAPEIADSSDYVREMIDILGIPLSEIGLSKRVRGVLRRERGIINLGNLLTIPVSSLRCISGIGPKSIKEIIEKTKPYRDKLHLDIE